MSNLYRSSVTLSDELSVAYQMRATRKSSPPLRISGVPVGEKYGPSTRFPARGKQNHGLVTFTYGHEIV